MRLLPKRPLPPYAYLPGHFPHPVRDPQGHSFGAATVGADPDAFCWGMDLFNLAYYWEAHEAWEELWRASPQGTSERTLLHGLILLSAAGVKLRERKWEAARRHGLRAAACILSSNADPASDLLQFLRLDPSKLSAMTKRAVLSPICVAGKNVFDFKLGGAADLTP